jgi:hypothetical protein
MSDRLEQIEAALATQRAYIEAGQIKSSDPWLSGYELTYEEAEWLIAEVKRLRRWQKQARERYTAWEKRLQEIVESAE